MIEILEWLQLLNALEKQEQVARNVNNIIFLGYFIVFLMNRKVVYLTAFFMCTISIEAEVMQRLAEYQIYLLCVVIYSYVFDCCKTRKQKFGCVTILLLSIALAVDAFLYGLNGYYGTSETLLYRNIESLALFAHLFFISSFIRYGRIRDSLRNFFASIVRITANSDYMLLFWYNRFS